MATARCLFASYRHSGIQRRVRSRPRGDGPLRPRVRPSLVRLGHAQYYGASLAALARLGREKGYRLVLVEPREVNAYFLRNDVGPDIPAVETATVHPDPAMDTQPLFDRLAEGGLQIVDLESQKE